VNKPEDEDDEDVMTTLQQGSFRVRQAALQRLLLDDEIPQQALVSALGDRRWEIRRDALALCCDRTDIPVVRLMDALVRDRSRRVRCMALVALCMRDELHARSPAYSPTIWACEHDPDARLRALASQLIGPSTSQREQMRRDRTGEAP
jgi:hypothetical protein